MCNDLSNLYIHLRLFIFNFRAETWAIAAGREDLIQFREALNVSHRLCGAHFESKVKIHGNERQRLLAQAVPTLFPSLEGSSSGALADHGYSHFLDVQRFSRKYFLTIFKKYFIYLIFILY